MSSQLSRPARARSLAEKQQRRADILNAAQALWMTTPYPELSMSEVASAASLAKGTLYLYFDTKEELFLALVDRDLDLWIGRTCALLAERRPQTPPQLADVLVEALEDTRSLRRLLSLLGTVLEHRVGLEQLRDFRINLKAQLQHLLALMPVERRVGERVLRHLYALAIGWQHLAEQMETGPVREAQELAGMAQETFVMDGAFSARGLEMEMEDEFELAVRTMVSCLTPQAVLA
ncbi:TetR/AcrR family transcriptional regulator [Deinococcus arenicola]|uniref:TetR/AcrR family transcriptional regulator n=1 Tax=Deinococcus arenicola TaxID=2994950 RepID=A0ABU4DNH4_9DEIO|nr:TetR/AcrR family transcriptional regulator [Deinococcus sp. ZS9-10]MDV6373903.1 TetR/AcrR family transcriptional regulator [Deinococcus sp. ZS9-10]